MSKERLDLLKKNLEEKGWVVLSGRNTSNLYQVYDETINWKILRNGGKEQLDLEFYIVDDFGGKSTNIKDLFRCEVYPTGETLYFRKLNNPKWRNSVDSFVQSLNKVRSE